MLWYVTWPTRLFAVQVVVESQIFTKIIDSCLITNVNTTLLLKTA